MPRLSQVISSAPSVERAVDVRRRQSRPTARGPRAGPRADPAPGSRAAAPRPRPGRAPASPRAAGRRAARGSAAPALRWGRILRKKRPLSSTARGFGASSVHLPARSRHDAARFTATTPAGPDDRRCERRLQRGTEDGPRAFRDTRVTLCAGGLTPGLRRSRAGARDLGPTRRGGAAQVAVDDRGALAALVDRPHDQRLAAARVAGREHALGRGRVGRRLRRCRARRGSTPSCSSSPCSGARKPIASRTRSAGSRLLGARDLRRTAARRCSAPSGSARRARCRSAPWSDREVALAALLERVRGAQLQRPARPRREVVGPAARAARRAARSA